MPQTCLCPDIGKEYRTVAELQKLKLNMFLEVSIHVFTVG